MERENPKGSYGKSYYCGPMHFYVWNEEKRKHEFVPLPETEQFVKDYLEGLNAEQNEKL